jgi:hypothetical protein
MNPQRVFRMEPKLGDLTDYWMELLSVPSLDVSSVLLLYQNWDFFGFV